MALYGENLHRRIKTIAAVCAVAGFTSMTATSSSPGGVCDGTPLQSHAHVGLAAPVLGGPEGTNLAAIAVVQVKFCDKGAEVRGQTHDARFDNAAASWQVTASYTNGRHNRVHQGRTDVLGVGIPGRVPFTRPLPDQPLPGLAGGYSVDIPAGKTTGLISSISVETTSQGSDKRTVLTIPNPLLNPGSKPTAASNGVTGTWAHPIDTPLEQSSQAARSVQQRWWYPNSGDGKIADAVRTPVGGWLRLDR